MAAIIWVSVNLDFFIITGLKLIFLTSPSFREGYNLLSQFYNEFTLFVQRKLKAENEYEEIVQIISNLRYLFKNQVFENEGEIRLIIEGETDKVFTSNESSCFKVYIETISLNAFITKIILGPRVSNSNELASFFYYNLKESEIGDQIFTSTLPYK